MHFRYDYAEEMKNPYHFATPTFYTINAEIVLQQQVYKLFLDINASEVIVAAYFTSAKEDFWVAYLSAFCRWLENKKLFAVHLEEFKEIFSRTEEGLKPFIFMPHALFSLALANLKDQPLRHKLLKQDPDSLVCRCFGLYEAQIMALVHSNPEIDGKGVTDETMAGGGCTSCSNDIAGIIARTKDFFGLATDKTKQLKIQGLYPAQMIILLDEILKGLSGDLEIISLNGYDLTLRAEENLAISVIETYVREKMNIGFKVFYA